ncbi:MAG: isopentenyl-diphosphate Delta-isomerase [Pseudomonadales bacterium]|jgi:isopentenyl-diphosphate delta-isomerase|nr:isopentenyl-diphosphate Delta-isomerase [Pseudomonadales bacterium]
MEDSAHGSPIVSDERDELILVDEADNEIGTLDKGACHDGEGVLHRAFSLFVFDHEDRLLLQQRAPGKRLWPGYWSNSCCSHPRSGETMEYAIARRLEEELGLTCSLTRLFTFTYHARFREAGSEHELCTVYAGRCSEDPRVNEHEISAWRWITPEELDAELAADEDGERFTPWFHIEWRRLRGDFRDAIADL